MASSVHPLANCARAYWLDDAGCEAADRAVTTAVEELLALLSAALDPRCEWSPRFWRMALGSFLWALLSHVFDHAADETPTRLAPRALGEADVNFSGRDFVLRLPVEADLQTWLDAVTAGASAEASFERALNACRGLQLSRARTGRKTPEALEGGVARLRRAVLFWEGHGQIGHYAAPFSHAEARGLTLRSGGRIRRLPCPERSSMLRYDGAAREALARTLVGRCTSSSALTRLALGPCVALLPTAFCEQRAELERWAARRPLPRVLASALGFERSPYFVALADRAVAAGGTLVGIQHGGYYGQTDPTWSERLENQVSDRYCTWGYRHRPQHVPMPSIRLSQLKARPSSRRAFGRRALWAYSATVAGATLLARVPHYRREAELNDVFIAAVRSARQACEFTLALRPYPRLGRDLMADAWRHQLADVAIEPAAGRTLLEHAAAYDLTIFNFPGATGFLEFLQADRPALIFCPPSFCPVRREAQSVYELLIETGLYAVDIEGFRRSIAEWCRLGPEWWNEPTRLHAREAFRREYARTSTQTVTEWARFLQDCATPAPTAAQA